MNLFRLAGNIISSATGFPTKIGGIAPGDRDDEVATISQTLLLSGDQTVSGQKTFDSAINATSGVLTDSGIVVGTNVTEQTNGDGRNFVTELSLSDVSISVAGAAAEAIGYLIATFPSGAHYLEVSYMDVALQGAGTVDADTPDVGIGTSEATGSVSVLGGTASFEDIITGQTASDCNGTATKALLKPTDQLSVAGDTKTVYFNVADTWAGADTVLATGTVVLKWTLMS